jgi:hypothetical protein
MQMKTAALAIALALTGLAAAPSFAQDRDVRTVTRETPSGAVVTHRTVIHHGPRDFRTYHHHFVRYGDRDDWRWHRTVVIHHREVPMRHVVVREIHHHRPAYVVNRHVTVIHNAG